LEHESRSLSGHTGVYLSTNEKPHLSCSTLDVFLNTIKLT
jgi:hypothetical protein